MIESAPNPIKATLPASMPTVTPIIASSEVQVILRYSTRRPARVCRTRSSSSVITIAVRSSEAIAAKCAGRGASCSTHRWRIHSTAWFTAARAGTYHYLCPLPGHAEMGMVGTFVVQ